MKFLQAGGTARPEGGGGTFKGACGHGHARPGQGASAALPRLPQCTPPPQSRGGLASPLQAGLTQISKVPLRFFPYDPKDLQSRKPKDSFINKSIYLKEYVTINYTK